MGVTYFKRYRMEVELAGRDFRRAPAPADYRLLSWRPEFLRLHAEIKFQSFHTEIDANVFACFTDRAGCLRLMEDIAHKVNFVPEATWLAVYEGAGASKREFCGTIQGAREDDGYGAIQNVGITPFHRGRGLGTRLVYAALEGFAQVGLRRAYLEVTAQNHAAVKLYQRIGFRRVRTLYRAVEVPTPDERYAVAGAR